MFSGKEKVAEEWGFGGGGLGGGGSQPSDGEVVPRMVEDKKEIKQV